MRFIDETEVRAILDPAGLIDAVEEGFRLVVAGRLMEREANGLRVEALGTNVVSYPAWLPDADLATVKVLTAVDGNAAAGRPMIDAVIIAARGTTGRIIAAMDGRSITALRTAAASAVAFRHISGRRGGVLGILGTGFQARAHALMLAAEQRPETVLIASASDDPARAADCARTVTAETGIPAAAVPVGRLGPRCDVVATTSLSTVPLLQELRPGAFLASVGPFRPGATEIAPELVATATCVAADDAARLRRHWHDDPSDPVAAVQELAGIIAGTSRVPDPGTPDRAARRGAAGHGVFLSDGRAFEDLVAARLVLSRLGLL